jgi:hypothetical protein
MAHTARVSVFKKILIQTIFKIMRIYNLLISVKILIIKLEMIKWNQPIEIKYNTLNNNL